ncbi:Site-specific recombinase XerD [Seinonella peptonophila]|uniref:Site-specific recombinase XerD n=1 Tax=Seinonella peptonophila TaxID=112248 RepID=A0A1M4YPI3_9BACL|nr:tyrosine-type recombinase/integrase [Seinonella peptonophila]SHF07306.1 Site-specific recombinase XerD [Seinonella peptonophila]
MAGQIIDRGKNKQGQQTYLLRVFMGRDATGKKKYLSKTVYGNKKDAQKELLTLLNQKDQGTLIEPSKDSVDKYLNHWLESSAKAKVRERTYQSYMDMLRLYIRPTLGLRRLSKLTPLEIQATYNRLVEQGLSASTIRRAHAVFNAALNQAMKWQIIQKNPAHYVELPRVQREEMTVLSTKQAKQFLEVAVYDKHYALFVLLLTTGLRPGEALGLKWRDLHDKKIRVQRSLIRNHRGGGWQLEEPKTKRSKRVVPIPNDTLEILRQHKIEQAKQKLQAGKQYEDHDLIFATDRGQPLHERNILQRNFKPLLKKADLPDMRLYDLRHTCATLLLAAGENPKIVSERLGHSSVVMTLDVYSHVLPDMQQQATEKLQSILFD